MVMECCSHNVASAGVAYMTVGGDDLVMLGYEVSCRHITTIHVHSCFSFNFYQIRFSHLTAKLYITFCSELDKSGSMTMRVWQKYSNPGLLSKS
uniref:Uncharacterized protein n=1 Tax=Nelumbo nucifera TaxID=4432 RepID=A0A822XSN8_NELNU|nr:TPA_asm: hypothetical protein HUJ06_024883 [Nelumbo nucifera]